MDKETMQYLSFQVDGDFVTDTARSWFWDERKPLKKCEEFLLACMCTDEITLEEKKDLCIKVLEGRLKFEGTNIFTLEDDNEKIRPLSDMIDILSREAAISVIKNDFKDHPLRYVDKFITKYSIRYFDDLNDDTMNILVRKTNMFDYFTMGPNNDYENRLGFKQLYGGAYLLNNAKLVYEIHGGPIKYNEIKQFEQELYEYWKNYLLNNNNSIDPRIDYIIERQHRYEYFINGNGKAGTSSDYTEISESAKEIIELRESSASNFRENILYNCEPDDMIDERAWISPDGDWYSCDFGGHSTKADILIVVLKKYAAYCPKGIAPTRSDDILIADGWVRFHNPYGGACYPDYNTDKGMTNRQKDRLFDAHLKFGTKLEFISLDDEVKG